MLAEALPLPWPPSQHPPPSWKEISALESVISCAQYSTNPKTYEGSTTPYGDGAFPSGTGHACYAKPLSLPGSSVLGILQAEYWNGLPCPAPGDLPNPGIEPVSLVSPALAGGLFTTSATWGMHSLKGNPSLHESRCSKVRRGLLLVLFALGRQVYSGTDRHHFQTLESGFTYQNPDWGLRPCRALRRWTSVPVRQGDGYLSTALDSQCPIPEQLVFIHDWKDSWMDKAHSLFADYTRPSWQGGTRFSGLPLFSQHSCLLVPVTSERCSEVRRFGRPLQEITDKEIGRGIYIPSSAGPEWLGSWGHSSFFFCHSDEHTHFVKYFPHYNNKNISHPPNKSL